MAEVVGLVGSVVGIAGFAGQLAQGSAFLYHFFNDFKDAPNDVRRIIDELKFLESLLASIQTTCEGIGHDQQLEQALQHCGDCINEILIIVKSLEATSNIKGPKNTWKKLRFALKQPQISRHLLHLERAKSLLLQSFAHIARKRDFETAECFQALHLAISNLSLGQESAQVATSSMQTSLEEIETFTSSVASSSAKITQVAMETHDLVRRLTEGTRQIQATSNAIDDAANKLVNETLEFRPALLREVGKEIRRTITANLQHHFDKKHGDTNLPSQEHSEACITNASRKRITGIEGFAQLRSISPQSPHNWARDGSQGHRRELIKNTMFGTLVVSTTTITYVRHSSNSAPMDKKIISETIVTFHPALWLFSRGVVLKIQSMKFLGRQNTSIPQFSLSTVNVRPYNSEIFRACIDCDLNKIRELFDGGNASPYDVDEYGKNLLGFVGMGAELPKKATGNDPVVHLADLFAVVKYLIDFGIDTGTLDNRLNIPIMTFISHWFYSGVAIPEYEDHFQYLFNMLLKSSKSDPFITSEAFICVKMDSPYILLEFLPGPHFLTYSWLPALEVIIRQHELTISWSPENISSLCKAGATYLSCEVQNTAHATEHISFWVLSSTIRIEEYLNAKSRILAELLTNKRLQDSMSGCNFRIGILGALRSGSEIIMLLTEWLGNPNEKLNLVLDFMKRVITMLLVHGSTDFELASTFNEISRDVLMSDLRIGGVWKRALREARDKVRGRKHFTITTHLQDLKNGKYKTKQPNRHSKQYLHALLSRDNSFTNRKPERSIKELEIEITEINESAWETDEEAEEESNIEAKMNKLTLITTASYPVAKSQRNCSEHEHDEEMKGESGNHLSHDWAQILERQSPSTENSPGSPGKLRWIAGVITWLLNSIV